MKRGLLSGTVDFIVAIILVACMFCSTFHLSAPVEAMIIRSDPVLDPQYKLTPREVPICDNTNGQKIGPTNVPIGFLYLPYSDPSLNLDNWTSQMDHSSPNYVRDGVVDTLGEKLSYKVFSNDPLEPLKGGTWSWPKAGGSPSFFEHTVDPRQKTAYIHYYQSRALALLYEFYDDPKAYLGYDGHDGHDFGMKGRTNVSALAATGGVVSRAEDTQGSLGKVVEIYIQPDYKIRYAHLNSYSVSKGNRVNPGDVIGVVGGSGGWAIHLHFSVYRWNGSNWQVTDPFGWDPWQDSAAQENDPLKVCNGEVSYNLWVDYWPRPFNLSTTSSSTPGRKSNSNRQGNSRPSNDSYLGGWLGDGAPPSFIDSSTYLNDVTLTDGSVVEPGVTYTKTWRLKNTGTTTWGSGYQLVFMGGQQMGAPSAVAAPSTPPGQEANISVNIVGPANTNSYTGNWQLRNAQGTFFGPTVTVKVVVNNGNPGTGQILSFDVSPASPSAATSVHLVGRIKPASDFRSMRFRMGDQLVEMPNPKWVGDQYEISTDWVTSGLQAGNYALVFEVAKIGDNSWSNPERQVKNYTLTGTTSTNHAPDRPGLKSPYDWYLRDASGSNAPVELCVYPSSDPDSNPVTYWFEVKDQGGGVYATSGWVSNPCWTNTFAPNTYSWRVKASDGNASSDWSADNWHFSVAKGGVYIGSHSFFTPTNPMETHMCVYVTYDGIQGPDVRAWINLAADNSENGEWRLLDHYGPNTTPDCTQPNYHGFWIRSPNYVNGTHKIKVSAFKPDSGANATMMTSLNMPYIRPSDPSPLAPSSLTNNGTQWNSRTIRFEWTPSLRVASYTLRVSTNSSPWDDPSPVLNQVLGLGTTNYIYTFNQDYAKLYWSIRASNSVGNADFGGGVWFGIDQVIPTCQVQLPSSTTYESVFQVKWAGTDNSAGVRSYDVQYKDSERGTWETWLESIPSSKLYELFIGQAGHKYSFRCRATDQAGNSGNFQDSTPVQITVDLNSRPAEPWWSTSYSQKRSITILNNMSGSALPANYPVKLIFNTGTSPSAAEIYNASNSVVKCNDLRIVNNNSTEINRYVKKCSQAEIEVWFRTVNSIIAGATDTNYQMYVGNASAANPPADPSQVWYPVRESDTANLYYFQEGSGATAYDSSGNGRTCSIISTVGWTDAKWGSGLQFNRANNGTTVSLLCGSPYPLSSLTAEFWWKSVINNNSIDGRLAGQMGSSGKLSWLVSVESDRLKFERWCNGGSQQARGNINLKQASYYGKWTYLAVTFDGGNQVKFYVNGNLDNSVTLNDSCSSTYNIPLEIGSVEGGGQGEYSIGAFRLSKNVKTSFYPGSLAIITNEPSSAAGATILPPVTGTMDLTILGMETYPNPDGGYIVQVQVQNIGNLSTRNGFYTDLYVNHIPTGVNDFSGSVRFWVNDSIDPGETVQLTSLLADAGAAGVNRSSAGSRSAPLQEVSATIYAQTDSMGVVTEPNNTNNIFSSGIPVCFANADAYESDNTAAAARLVTPGQTEKHNYHNIEDQDWVKFSAQAGKTYQISTSNLGAAADTYLYLYGTDKTTLLASNDDTGETLASQIVWTAPTDGTYYIKVEQWNPSVGGCGTAYDLLIAISGSTTVTISGNAGIASATITYTDSTASSPDASAGLKERGGSVVSDSTGRYTFNVASGWSGVVTPTKDGYSFTPTNRTYTNVIMNTTGQNYTALAAKPGSFTKTSPLNNALNLSNHPMLKWGPSANATSYQYCIDTTADTICSTSWISTGANTSISLSKLSLNKVYYWQVRAKNATGTTYSSGGWWKFTVPPAPGVFGKSSPFNGNNNVSKAPTLKWNPSSSAMKYEYCIDSISGSTCDSSWISVGSNTSVSLSGLVPGTVYYWQVRARNAVGTTYANGSTTWWKFKVPVAPMVFGKVSPVNGATDLSTSLTLGWLKSTNAVRYEYCFDNTDNNICDTSWISAGNVTSINLTGLADGLDYFWQVRAVNASGKKEADEGVWWKFTIPS